MFQHPYTTRPAWSAAQGAEPLTSTMTRRNLYRVVHRNTLNSSPPIPRTPRLFPVSLSLYLPPVQPLQFLPPISLHLRTISASSSSSSFRPPSSACLLLSSPSFSYHSDQHTNRHPYAHHAYYHLVPRHAQRGRKPPPGNICHIEIHGYIPRVSQGLHQPS